METSPPSNATVGTKSIQAAVISSFCTTGESRDWEALPAACKFIDVYAFMQRCLPGKPNGETNAIEHLAQLYRNGMQDAVTSDILQHVANRQVAALATFMPELTAAEIRKDQSCNALDALKLLVDVVRQLKARGHPVKLIELVGGSRIQSICYDHGSPRLSVEQLPKHRSILKLIERLRPLAEYAMEEDPVYLSVELEPGPLFILSDAGAITQFCQEIEVSGSRALKKCVGLNLDIPHWHFLAGISPDWLASPKNELVRTRVIHAHLCDHHVGHFCDTVPETFNSAKVFYRWLSLLHQIHNTAPERDMPEFSGFVSCEMEACKDPRMLEGCFQTVETLLTDVNKAAGRN